MRFGPLMSSRGMIRRLLIAGGSLYGVPQLPLVVFPVPQVRRAELVREPAIVVTRERGLFEHPGGHRELVRRDAEVTEDLVGEALRELVVEAPHQRDALVARDVTRADFLRGVVARAAETEL